MSHVDYNNVIASVTSTMVYTFQFKFWWFFQRLKQIESFTCTNCILVSYIFGGEILLSTCRWCCAVHWIKAPTHGAHFCTKLMEFTFYYLFFLINIYTFYAFHNHSIFQWMQNVIYDRYFNANVVANNTRVNNTHNSNHICILNENVLYVA